MSVSAGVLSVLITVALLVTAVAPIVLLTLFARDWMRGKLW